MESALASSLNDVLTWQPDLLDHGYVLLFAVLFPAVGSVSYRRLLRKIAEGHAPDRAALLRATLIAQWILFAVGVALWLAQGRSWRQLGLGWEVDAGLLIGLALGAAIIAGFGWQLRAMRTVSSERIRALHQELAPVSLILPRTQIELKAFYRVSVTAGIVEEILWRGWLTGYLAHFCPIWLAAVLSALGFGLAHAYQGAAQLPRVTAAGTVLVVLFLLTGSVWVSVIVHALVDILQGRLAFEVLNRAEASGETGSAG